MNEIIRNLINEWDPVDLINQGAPNNEYEYEIIQLSNYLKNEITIQELAIKIYTLFKNSFGDDVFNKEYDECFVVASKYFKQKNKGS